jgi:hypothetical protein
VISTDAGNTFSASNIVAIWDNRAETAGEVYSEISNTGSRYYIDISQYSGNIKVGFYLETLDGSVNHHLYIDNIQVKPSPMQPIFSLSPNIAQDFGTVLVSQAATERIFTIANIGLQGELTIEEISVSGLNPSQFRLSNNNAIPMVLGAEESISIGITFSPTSAGNKSAILTIRQSLSNTPVQIALLLCHN